MARRPVVLLAVGLTLLLGAWIVATHPFDAPDEASHYVRAWGIANGTILGKKVPYYGPQLTPTQAAFINHDTRAVEVPAKMSPPNIGCLDRRPNLTGSCLEATPNGNFPPLGYVLPAAGLKAASNVSNGLWFSRTASLIQSLAFLLLAVALLWDGTGWSLLGLLVAITPMVLFSSSVMNSSGIEIASCLAFAAGGVRIAREPAHAPGWVWITFAGSGVVAILSGPLGVVFGLADLAVFAALLGARGFRTIRERRPAALRNSGLILLAAAILAVVYARIAGFSPSFGISPIRLSLVHGVDQLGFVLRDAVGNFASLTVLLPVAVRVIWWGLVVLLVAGALWLGTRRDRVVVLAVTALALAFPVLFWAWVDRYSGYGLQGREVLPVLLLIPLVAGEVIYVRRGLLSGRRAAWAAPGAVFGVIAIVQGYSWWYSARAAAGASGTLRFYAHATWKPPLGWIPWIAVALAGTLALLGFAVVETVRGSPRRTAPSG